MEKIITPSQAAALLQLHVRTVYRLAEQGAIPGNKIGRSWRFSKKDILDLVSKKRPNGAKGGSLTGHKKAGSP